MRAFVILFLCLSLNVVPTAAAIRRNKHGNAVNMAAFLAPSLYSTSPRNKPCCDRPCASFVTSALPSWSDLESMIGDSYTSPRPVSVDSVLQPSLESFSKERPTLFRERHGWCPYSERVWLTLELYNVAYDTVRIDNTGGPRPPYFYGTTPQLQWPDGTRQGESMDLVRDLDKTYGASSLRYDASDVQGCISQFRNIFPSRARPSSRAAFLFQGNGDALLRSVFEETLHGTDELLSKNGPFFCGDSLSAADVAWAPFLERYRYQLPCLHQGLEPFSSYPHLKAWYDAMDQIPVYACRVKGDASSWRKVLSMAGFGNAGVPPQVGANMEEMARKEVAAPVNQELWTEYASDRPYVAATPAAEAASILIRNREAIVVDAMKRSVEGLFSTESELDEAMRAMAHVLINGDQEDDATEGVGALASFLDERMCVPRDMGAMSAATIKQLAWNLSS